MANDVNTGFCAGQNAGINEARGEYVLPLNPDVRLSPDFISNLVQVMQQDRSIGTVTGKLYLEGSDPKTSAQLLDSTGMFIERTRRQYLRGHGTPDLGQFDTGGFVFGACGAAPLLRREMLTDTRVDGDYFDRDFFAHKEDVDLAWRAQLLGWKAWYEPAATAYHDRTFRPGSGRRKAISSTIKGAAVRNRYFTILKNDLPQNVIRDMPKILSYDVAILIYLIIFERSSLVGVKQAIQALPRMSAKRRMIMRRRRVSSRYMRQVMEPAP
jgi:GT2 family glycosyltransferase